MDKDDTMLHNVNECLADNKHCMYHHDEVFCTNARQDDSLRRFRLFSAVGGSMRLAAVVSCVSLSLICSSFIVPQAHALSSSTPSQHNVVRNQSRVLTDSDVNAMAGCEAVLEGDTVVIRPKNGALEGVISGFNGNNPLLQDKQLDFEKIKSVLSNNYLDIKKIRLDGKIFAYKSIAGLFNLSGSDVASEGTDNRFLHIESLGNLGEMDVSNVTNMYRLFKRCVNITDVSPLAQWDVSHVENFGELFRDCTNLSDLSGVKAWNVSRVRDMSSLFSGTNITSTDAVSSWKTDSLVCANGLLSSCKHLTSLEGLTNWNTSKVTSISAAFAGCESLKSLKGLEKWDTSSVQFTRGLFADNAQLTDISALRNWNVSKAEEFIGLFNGCRSLKDGLALTHWKTSNLKDMSYTFGDCTSLEHIGSIISHWDTSKVTNLSHAFDGVPSDQNSTILDLSNKVFNDVQGIASFKAYKGILIANNWSGDALKTISHDTMFAPGKPKYLLLTNTHSLLDTFKNEQFSLPVTITFKFGNPEQLITRTIYLPAVYDTSAVIGTAGLSLAEREAYAMKVIKPVVDKAVEDEVNALKAQYPLTGVVSPHAALTTSPMSLFQQYVAQQEFVLNDIARDAKISITHDGPLTDTEKAKVKALLVSVSKNKDFTAQDISVDDAGNATIKKDNFASKKISSDQLLDVKITRTSSVVIPAKTVYVADDTLAYRQQGVIEQAVDGQNTVTTTINNGKTTTTTVMTRAVRNGLVHVGNKEVIKNGNELTVKIYRVNSETGSLYNPTIHVEKPWTKLLAATPYAPNAAPDDHTSASSDDASSSLASPRTHTAPSLLEFPHSDKQSKNVATSEHKLPATGDLSLYLSGALLVTSISVGVLAKRRRTQRSNKR